MKKLKVFFIAVLTILLSFSYSTVVAFAGEKTFKIGALLHITGTWSETGTGVEKALQIALPQVNTYLKGYGIRFELDVHDTESDPAVALRELKEMHAEGINTVIGPMTSEESKTVIQYADDNDILLLSPSATSSELSQKDNFFRMAASDSMQADGLSRIMKNNYNVKNVSIIYMNDTYGRSYKDDLLRCIDAMGIRSIGEFPIDLSAPDYQMINKNVEKEMSVVNSEDTAVVMISSGQYAVDLVKSVNKDSSLRSVKWFVSADIIGSNAFMEDEKAAEFAVDTKMEGLSIGYKDISLDALPYIGQLLEGAVEYTPYAITAWDSLWLLADTYSNSDEFDTESLKTALSATAENYRNANGAINVFDENGDTVGARFMRYEMSADDSSYTWKCLGHYMNPGVGEPILHTIEWKIEKSKQEILIGVLLPYSGDRLERVEELSEILDYAAKIFNEYAASCGSAMHITLVKEDAGSTAIQAEAALQKLIARGVSGIIGPTASVQMEGLKPIIDSSGIPVISPLSTVSSLAGKDSIYRTIFNDNVQVKAMSELIAAEGKNNIIVINCNDTYGTGFANAFKKNFAGTVTSFSYNSDDTNFSDVLKKAEESIPKGDSSKTAVVAVSYSEIADLIKQMKGYTGLSGVAWYGTESSGLSDNLLRDKDAAAMACQVGYTAPDYSPYGNYFDPLYQVINYELQPNVKFKESSMSAFDGLWLLACSYLENGYDADRNTINDYISTHAFRGVGGVLALDENGDRRFGYYKFYRISEEAGQYQWENNALYSLDHAHNSELDIYN